MSTLKLHNEAYYESRKPQEDLGPLKNCLRFIWNREKKAFLDRTLKSWAYVLIFYLIFFGFLFSLFAFKLWITLYIISSTDRPYIKKINAAMAKSYGGAVGVSFLRMPSSSFGSPGIGFKPNILTPTTSPIIWVSKSHRNAHPERYIAALDNFLHAYKTKNRSAYDSTTCREGKPRHQEGKPCFFDVESLGVCGKQPYGYSSGDPCVIISFNRMFDWMPNYYNATSELPVTMPASLKSTIRSSKEFHIWLSCVGANNVDKEHIGDIDYLPNPGFPVKYFPFAGQRNYLSPIVALHFKSLTVNRLITVECSVWAKNVGLEYGYSLDLQIIIGK